MSRKDYRRAVGIVNMHRGESRLRVYGAFVLFFSIEKNFDRDLFESAVTFGGKLPLVVSEK